jgi:putative acetyltransferase
LGHPAYYPRFGFLPSRHFGIGCEYEAPDGAFLVKELQYGYLNAATGTIKYHVAFKNV